jgi:L-fuculose-phosphate aldolase
LKQRLTSLKNDILQTGKMAYARGYVASNDGNISARIDTKYILITPTGVSKGFMKAQGLVVVDLNGKIISGTKKPSSEMYTHLQIYNERADVGSICHVHPPFATGFSVAGIPLEQDVLSEVSISLGNIPLVPYGTPGTKELFDGLQPFLQDYDAFLLANHGALTVGADVFDAYFKMETLEHYAQILFIAKQLGKVNKLSTKQVQVLRAQREKFDIKTTLDIIAGERKSSE